MRTTLDIDDDILAAVKEVAKAEGKTMGEVISDLARRALTTSAMSGLSESGQAPFDPGAWPTLPNRGGGIVTMEMIERIQDELDREDGEALDFTPDGDAKPRSGVE